MYVICLSACHVTHAAAQYCYIFEKLATTVGAPLSLTAFTLRRFLWATAIVCTRRNRVPIDGARVEDCLIPMWDMCNHRLGHIATNFVPAENEAQCDAQHDTGKAVLRSCWSRC